LGYIHAHTHTHTEIYTIYLHIHTFATDGRKIPTAVKYQKNTDRFLLLPRNRLELHDDTYFPLKYLQHAYTYLRYLRIPTWKIPTDR
jgi:hypothetical protein